MRHRLHVWPWTRFAGRFLLPNWLAIAIGPHVIAWRALTEAELAHELEHVRQWQRYGWTFPLRYAVEAIRARRAGLRWYADNRFEREAHRAAEAARRR